MLLGWDEVLFVINFNLSGVKSGDVGVVCRFFDAVVYELGDKIGDSMDRVDTLLAFGIVGLMGVVPVLPNPP